MRFIENVNFETVARRAIAGRLSQLADLVNATVGCRVNLNDINGIARANFRTGIAYSTRLGHRLLRRSAVKCHRQDARNGRLADPAMSAEDVAVRSPPLFDSCLQRAGDVILPNHFREFLRTIFSREDLVAHDEEMV